MASDQTLRAIITVLDRTAEPIRQINTRWAAMSSPPIAWFWKLDPLAVMALPVEELMLLGEQARRIADNLKED